VVVKDLEFKFGGIMLEVLTNFYKEKFTNGHGI
jgi:hypothetical protein